MTASPPTSPPSVGRHIVSVVSLLATPLLLFIVSANSLYLNNQKEFQHQVQVLFPFIALFFLTVAVGAALYALSKHPLFRGLLWAYYLAGPFFLVLGFLQNWSIGAHIFLWVFDTWAGVLAYGAVFGAVTVWAASRFQTKVLVAPFAVFSIILLATETRSFLTRYQPHPPESTTSELPQWETREDLPNIYHVILDGYQADFFPQTLSPEERKVLSGFINYPNNVSLYPVTNMSLPSIFMGRRRPNNLSNGEYMKRAFNTDASFLYWLRQAGYKTLAYAPKVYEFDLTLFDHVTFHQHNPGAEALVEMNTATFKRLWFWANSPRLFTRLLLSTEWFFQFGEDDLKLVKNKNFLPFSVPITSYLSFENYLRQEEQLPARGRYTLIHLVIPHSPEVLTSNCSYDYDGRRTSQLEQAGCATRLLVQFVERLRELDRLDDSLVIVHADHGAYDANSKAGTHSPESVSLAALLLIKPIGSQGEMTVSAAKSSLVDVAPTLLWAAGVKNQFSGEGSLLGEALAVPPVARLD
jgi:hypothetical protein